jgi:hypothetical protein
VAFEPRPLPQDPRFILVASYFLPIRPIDRDDSVEPVWFRVYAYFDLATGAERIVLSYGNIEAAEPLVRIQRESLLERFRLADGGAGKSLWHACVRRMVANGAGLVTFVSPDGFDADLQEMPGDAAPSARLLSHHLQGRPVSPIVFDGEADMAAIHMLVQSGSSSCEGFLSPAADGSGDHSSSTARDRLA